MNTYLQLFCNKAVLFNIFEIEIGTWQVLSNRITAIEIPEDLNFAGEPVPFEDPEIMERVDREFLVNTYWQSNALLLMKRANKFFPIIDIKTYIIFRHI